MLLFHTEKIIIIKIHKENYDVHVRFITDELASNRIDNKYLPLL